MKHNQLFIIIAIMLIGCKTQKGLNPIGKVELYPIGKNGLWGYANEYGEVEIPYQFDSVSFFHVDRASVKKDGKFRFINRFGEYQIKQKYDSIGYFDYYKANVVKNGKKLTIDRNGKKLDEGIIIGRCGTGIEYASNPNDIFQKINNKYILNKKEFENQKRLDPTANYKLSNFTFDDVMPFSSKSVIVKKDGKFGIYVHFNSVGLREVWADEIIPNFSNKNGPGKLIQARNAKYKINDKWGVISSLGHIQIEPEFMDIKYYSNKIMVEYKPNHWGCITWKKKYFVMNNE